MSKTPVKLHQVGDNVTEGKEVKTQQAEMMKAEAKRRLIIAGKAKK